MRARLLLMLSLSAAAVGCGTPSNSCDVSVCPTGCCDSNGLCQGGATSLACGSSGMACQVCAATDICLAQACLPASFGAGGGTAGGSAGGAAGGTAGGAAGGSAGGTAGGAGGGTVAATITINRVGSGVSGGIVQWTYGSASGTCPGQCTAASATGGQFHATVGHDEFTGFTAWSSNCGTNPLECTLYATSNVTVTAAFQAQAGSPHLSSQTTFSATDTTFPTMHMASDGDAGFLLAGKTSGSVNFGSGPVSGDGYLAAFSETGVVRWAEHLPNQGSIEIFDVAARPDAIVIGGRCSSANFADAGTALPSGPCVARLDGAGAVVWSKGWAGTGNVERVALSSTGAVGVAGVIAGTFNLGTGALTDHGGDDFFFGLLDPSGATVLARRGGKGYGDYPGGVAFAPNGDVLFSAQLYGGPATFETISLTQANFQTASLIARYSSAGVFLSGRALNGQVLAKDLLTSATDDVYFVGEYQNTVDFGGVSLNAGAGFVAQRGVVVKYNPSLQAQWAVDGDSSLYRASVATDGSVALMGSYYLSADWGGGYLTSTGAVNSSSSGLAVKVNPSGSVAWSKRIATGINALAFSGSKLWVAGHGTLVVGTGTPAAANYLVSYPR